MTPSIEIDISPEQVSEITRSLMSPEYFIETFCWLQQKASAGVAESNSIVPFMMGHGEGEPHYFQRKIIRWLHDKRNVLTLKSRRVGCSWIAAAYAAWLINFHENVNCLFISRSGKEAQKILDKVKFILKNLAYHDNDDIRHATTTPWLCGEIVVDNSERIAIGYRDDGGNITVQSVVESLTTTDDAARGEDATFIVFDELAFYEHPDETWSGATKALALGGHWMAVSTPAGIGEIFHRLCARGDLYDMGKLDEDELGYEYIKIHWRDAGIREDQVTRASVGDTEEKRNQEWEWNFISPGTVAFDPTHLAVCYRPPEEFPEVAEAIKRYQQVVYNSAGEYMYYSGVDTASGKPKIHGSSRKRSGDRDYHAFTVLSKERIQVYSYQSREPISSWAGKTIDDGAEGRFEVKGKVSLLHEQYPGLMYIEEEGPGYTTAHQHQCPQDSFSQAVPIKMRELMKRSIVDRLKILIESHQIIITDPFTYQCLTVYQQLSPGVYGAPTGYFDDPVIALALASAALDSHGALAFTFGSVNAISRGLVPEPMDAERLGAGPLVQIDIAQANQRMVDLVTPINQDILADYNRLVGMAGDDDYIRDRLNKEQAVGIR